MIPILYDIELIIPKNKITGIIGASGSGKSMLLKSILQLYEGIEHRSSSGQICVFAQDSEQHDLAAANKEALISFRKNHFGFVFQLTSEVLNPSQRIYQQLSERLQLTDYKLGDFDQRCLEVLEEVGIDDPALTLKKYPHQLSGGQLQRVLIAIGIIHKPKVLLIDEPTSALNSALKKEILELINRLSAVDGMTIILVSHNLALVAQYCQYLAVIDEGRIVESGLSSDIINDPQHKITKGLLYVETNTEDSVSNDRNENLIFKLKNISHAFQSSKGFLFKKNQIVLQDFNLSINEGEIIGLVGESGSGKSTVGKILAGFLMPDSGEVLYQGTALEEFSKSQYKQYRSEVQIIFQDPFGSLSPHRTAKQVLSEAIAVFGLAYDQKIVEEKLNDVSLDSRILGKTPKQMSGGQRQRLLIARALLASPKLLICDEILSSLDTIVKKKILKNLKSVAQQYKMAILFISHDLDTVQDISDRIVNM